MMIHYQSETTLITYLKTKTMNKYKEALQKIELVAYYKSPLRPEQKLYSINEIVTEVLQSESRMYSEEEVIGFADWYNNLSAWDDYKDKSFKGLLKEFLQSLQPKTEESKLNSGYTVEEPSTYAIKMAENDKICFAPCSQSKIDLGQCGCHNKTMDRYLMPTKEQPTSPSIEKEQIKNKIYTELGINEDTWVDDEPVKDNNVASNLEDDKLQLVRFVDKNLTNIPNSEKWKSPSEKIAEERINKERTVYWNELPKVFYIDYLRAMIGAFEREEITFSRLAEILNEDAYNFYKANNSLEELEKWVKDEFIKNKGILVYQLLDKIQELKTK